MSNLKYRNLADNVSPWLLPIFIIIIWQILGQVGIISAKFLPTPSQVLKAGVRLIENGQLQENILISSGRAFAGLFIGGGIGFILGIVNGLNKAMATTFDTSIQMLRTIPHLALIPLVILWFGIGEEAKFFLVALGVSFPIYLNTYNGIKNVDPKLIEMGVVYGLKPFGLFKDIIFPGAFTSMLVGFRYALGVMWTSLIVAETIGADSGIGFMATSAREFMQMDVIVLSILVYAILGKLSDVVANMLEKRMLSWNPVFATQTKQVKGGDGSARNTSGFKASWKRLWHKYNT
jgi:sulfonate transport system permease protein